MQTVVIQMHTCDGDGVWMPLYLCAHKPHHFCKSHIPLKALGPAALHCHGAASHSCTCSRSRQCIQQSGICIYHILLNDVTTAQQVLHVIISTSNTFNSTTFDPHVLYLVSLGWAGAGAGLCCAVLCCAALCCAAVLRFAALCCAALRCAILCL